MITQPGIIFKKQLRRSLRSLHLHSLFITPLHFVIKTASGKPFGLPLAKYENLFSGVSYYIVKVPASRGP